MPNIFKKITPYLPIFFALTLIAGILLGLKLGGVSSYKTNVLKINTNNNNKLTNIINYISEDYVDSVNKNKFVEESITEILKGLDPHSQYITAEDYNIINDPLQGNFEGIGIEFRIVKDTITVIHAIPGGPSEKVGIKGGDRIIKIDDTLVAGVGLASIDAMRMLKGERDTKVNVSIHRRGVDELIDFTIIRDVIPTYSLDASYIINDSIGYIKLNKFSNSTYSEFNNALNDLLEQGISKIILDLRGNVGGYLQAAIRIADEFLSEDKLIVYTKGNSRPKNTALATEKGNFENKELVVLIDEGSASASEVLAGAIQDNDRGTIIGRRSFGKGLVQEQLNFSDGSALRLTVARYYTPTGRCIQKPYNESYEDYLKEYYERFTNGELLNPDSIEFNDSLKYTTPGGKVVYGGGGIMPDIYVPLVKEDNDFYNKLVRRGLIYKFAFDYTDQYRDTLNTFGSYNEFRKKFVIDNTIFDNFLKYVKNKGITGTDKQIRSAEERIKILMKAYIAQNIFNNESFYPIYHQIDDIVQKALEYFSEHQN